MYYQFYEYIENFLNQLLCGLLRLQEKILTTLDKHVPKKIKTIRGNQKPHINKTLRKAIMKRSQLKNKGNKTRNAADVSDYKKQRNYVVKLNS